MYKLGDKVKIKSSRDLMKIAGKGPYPVKLESGLVFHGTMLQFSDSKGYITEIVSPDDSRKGEENQLKEPSYRIGAVEIFWTADMIKRDR